MQLRNHTIFTVSAQVQTEPAPAPAAGAQGEGRGRGFGRRTMVPGSFTVLIFKK